MPMPWTYRHPDTEWQGFLDDIREVLGTPSSNVAYTAADGVFRAFRRRLTVDEALAFAQVLPAVARALFVQDFVPEPPAPWAGPETYVAEALALRRDHNFAGPRCLEAVSYAVHRMTGPDRLERALRAIGPEAEAFWRLEGYSPDQLAVRFR